MTGPIDREVRIRVEMRNDLSRPADEASVSLRRLGDRAERTAAQMQVLKEREDALARSNEKLALTQAAYRQTMADSASTDQDKIKAITDLNRALKDVERATSDVVNATKRIDKQNSTYLKLKKNIDAVEKAFNKFSELGSVFMPFVKGGLALLAVTQVLAPALMAVVAGLAPLAGGLTVIPGAIAAIAQMAVVGVVAFHGMGQAISDMTANIVDWSKVNQELSQMSPAARQFAMQMASLDRDVIKPMNRDIQQAFFENFRNAIPEINNFIALIRGPLEQTASEMGRGVSSALDRFTNGQNATDIQKVMDGTNVSITEVMGGFTDLGESFLHFMALAQPFLQWMSAGFKAGAENIDRWVHSASGANTITNFFQRSRAVMSGAWAVLKNIGVALVNVGKDATGFSSYMGGGLLSLTQKFRQWTGSAKGQRDINQWFHQAETIFKALMGDLGKILPLLGKFSNDPRLANVLTQIANAATKLINTLLESGGLQDAIGIVARLLNDFANLVARMPGGVKHLAGVVIGLAIAFNMLKLGAVVGAVSSLIEFIPVLLAGLEALTGGMVSFDIAVDANPIGGIITLVLALVAAVGFATYEMLMHWRGMVTGLKTAYDYTLKPVFNAFASAARWVAHTAVGAWQSIKNAWHSVTSSLKRDWEDFVKFYNKTVGLIPFVGKAFQINGGNATGKNAKGQSAGNTSWLSFGALGGLFGGLVGGPLGATGGGVLGSLLGKVVGKWSGGAVLENRPYLVGEKGPEWYQSGHTITPVGLDGPEIRFFDAPGTIVPNHLYDRMMSQMAMSSARARQAMEDPAVTITAPGTGNGDRYITMEGSDYQITVNTQDSQDMRRQVKRLVRELMADEEARRINWKPRG